MKVLVINSGSSSIKFQLFEMPQKEVLCSGLVEKLGLDTSVLHFNSANHKIDKELSLKDHHAGLKEIVELLLDQKVGVISKADDITLVGHRVVHGGSTFSNTTIINEDVKSKIKDLFDIAPLHNPPNYVGIEVAELLFPKAVQVAIFDTAFHQTIPEKAYTYAIPTALSEKHKIRMYGFHGTSHKYVTQQAQHYLKNKNSKIITVHLGNGCSITAVNQGQSVDHSLGFGPVNGLVMGTRSGDIDQSIIFYLIHHLEYSPQEVNDLLQKKSGMLGLTGYSDLRDIETNAAQGDRACQLALEINAYRIKKYIGAYVAAMNGIDAIVFTAGIGENSETMRALVCSELDFFGVSLDKDKNKERSKSIREINTKDSRVKVLVIPTNEEIEIASQAYDLISPNKHD